MSCTHDMTSSQDHYFVVQRPTAKKGVSCSKCFLLGRGSLDHRGVIICFFFKMMKVAMGAARRRCSNLCNINTRYEMIINYVTPPRYWFSAI